jgi:hypothetical protein
MEKKTPPAKTPANNAGSGATADLLPPVPARVGERDLRNVADLFRRSGWFGEMTTAQLATLIIVGESLGLDAGQSVFDLTITAADEQTPAKVAYRENRTYEAAADRIDALRAANKPESGNKDVPGDAATPDPAVSEQTPPAGTRKVERRPTPAGGRRTTPNPALRTRPPRGTPTKALHDRRTNRIRPNATSWRGSIISMLRETGATEQAINDRLDKFDAADRRGPRNDACRM